MDTYRRGQWSKDEEYHDEDVKWVGPGDTWLKYLGFDGPPEISVGDESDLNVRIYFSDDTESVYPFFALINTCGRLYWYLVPDFPSVLMLVKEVMPIIAGIRETKAAEAVLEEVSWRAKQEA